MLGSVGLPGIIVILFVVLLLFGRGRLGALMGDVGRGLTSIRLAVRGDRSIAEPSAVPALEDGTRDKAASPGTPGVR